MMGAYSLTHIWSNFFSFIVFTILLLRVCTVIILFGFHFPVQGSTGLDGIQTDRQTDVHGTEFFFNLGDWVWATEEQEDH